MPARGVTLVLDVALVKAWVHATGDGDSEFWTLYLIVIVTVALRFGIVETVGVALGLAVVNVVVLVQGDDMWTARLYRPTLLLVAGFAGGHPVAYSPADSPIAVAVTADEHRARFEVRDAGRGVAEADRESIFGRFRRADDSGASGAGLGLYISRGLVRAHGGEREVAIRPEAERPAPLAAFPRDVKTITVSTVRPD